MPICFAPGSTGDGAAIDGRDDSVVAGSESSVILLVGNVIVVFASAAIPTILGCCLCGVQGIEPAEYVTVR